MSDIRILLVIVFLGIQPPSAVADDARPTDWGDVSQIFAKNCINCHSSHGAALGLRLDSYNAALAGSVRGAVLVPGDSGNSELVRRLRGESVPRMPFLGYPLKEEEIALIEHWINGGLPDRRH
jgi:mono/diheme cytochrome c family protein